MATARSTRLQVGSAAWIAEERGATLQMVRSEIEDFSSQALMEVDWLNEHMADIFNENQINVVELFKTPGKLRGKTPRTARKNNDGEARVPLSDIFSATPKGAPNPFTQQLLNKAQTPKVKVAQTEDTLSPGARPGVQEHPQPSPKVPTSKFHVPVGDSGYFGSQSADTVVPEARAVAAETVNASSPRRSTVVRQNAPPAAAASSNEDVRSPTQRLTDSFHSAKEQQTTKVVGEETTKVLTRPPMSPRQPSPTRAPQPSSPIPVRSSPLKTAPVRSSPFKAPTEDPAPASPLPAAVDALEPAEKLDEEVRSPSDGSSPIRRPLVRKSSLSFAPLPARERLTTTKSMGAQASLNRPSYYPRITGGKSLGNVRLDAAVDDDMDLDHGPAPVATKAAPAPESDITKHNKTYTQRLQDQINLLGQSQANAARVAKPMGSAAAGSQSLAASQPKPSQEVRPMSPGRKPVAKPAPGTFPDDEEDEWIAPPGQNRTVKAASPRPPTGKAYSTDVVDGLHSKEAAGGADFQPPKQRQVDVRPPSPQKLPFVPERATSVLGHAKSASVPHLPGLGIEIGDDGLFGHKKTISVSNPTLATVNEDSRPGTPSKSPSRSYKDSPLKQVKNKLSSILKTSKGLLASSAALSAEGKSSILSPSTTRLALHLAPSMDSVYQQTAFASQDALYPDLSKHANPETQTLTTVSSPSRPVSQRTRSSTDKEEKREEKRREKEQKEARRLAEMADKLEKAREKEREKARVFSKEQQEKMEKQLAAAAAREQEMMEKQLVAAAAKEQERIEKQRAAAAAAAAAKEQERIEKQRAAAAAKEQERMMKQQQAAVAAKEHEKADEPLQPSSPSRPARTSPRKAKAQAEEEARAQAPPIAEADEPDGDVEMADALPVIGPSAPTPGPAAKTRQLRRPVKPAKEIPVKAKQAPTLIRINTGSQQSQFHPSNSLLSATLQNAVTPGGPSQPRLTSKASSQSLQTKPSIQSLKSSTTTTASGRSKALEMATKKKEQQEREAQKKREAKAEAERKRAAQLEEERRLEQQRQAEAEAEALKQEEAKKLAAKQAAIEKAKQTRAPPPAVRTKPNGPPDYSASRDDAPPYSSVKKSEVPIPRPPSRLNNPAQRLQEELGRPVNSSLASSTASKAAGKRPLQQDGHDDAAAQRNAQARTGTTFQAKDNKRQRTSDELGHEDVEMESHATLKGPPVRPSAAFKKDGPNKSFIPGKSTNMAPYGGTSKDMLRAAVSGQQMKTAAHPLDMAQVSKAPIPFATNPAGHAPAPSAAMHKTPARPPTNVAKSAAKSAPRSSPRFPNGDSIELPEIETDDEDSDEDDGRPKHIAPWADSPDLRQALVRQETMDPTTVFGIPGPINMEEVFAKSKDKWHKFRARTSSANWSGADRLTEEDIRKDLAARDLMRRQGGWSYEMGRDLV